MTLEEAIGELQRELLSVPDSERMAFIKGWISNIPDKKRRVALTAFLGCLSSVVTPQIPSQVVVLLHGIRTVATWQSIVSVELGKIPNVHVRAVGYGWVDAIRFWLPMGRRSPEAKVVRELHLIKDRFPDSDLIVIAHSFSTYLMGRILDENRTLRLTKLVLCGSILPRDFRWDKVQDSGRNLAIVNEVGTKDFWPVMARVTSWGYGCSGTMGFETSLVDNRFFDYGHSDFFTPEHVTTYWVPFVQSGLVVASPWAIVRPAPGWLLEVAGNLPYIKVILSTLIFLCGGAIWWVFSAASKAIGSMIG